MRKKLILFLIAGIAAIAGLVGLESVKAQSAYNGRFDHPSNIIRGGTLTKAEFAQRYSQNKTGDLPAIFRHYGVNSGNINSAQEGTVNANGEVKVNGKVVATGAYALGRQTLGSPQARAINIAGKTYYEKPMAASIAPHKEVTAFVFLDGSGKYVGAIMKGCGNPVTAKPVPQPVAECTGLTAKMTSRTRYDLDAHARVANGATIKGYRYVITDASGRTVLDRTVNTASAGSSIQGELSQAGTYNVRVTVKTSLGDRTADKCTAKLTVAPAPKPTAECVDLTAKITNRTNYDLDAHARVTNGATITGYTYLIKNASGQTVLNRTVNTASTGSSIQGTLPAGTYTAQVTVKTSLGDRTGENCKASFTVKPEEKPPVVKYIKVCDIKTKKIITIKESERDESKHAPVDSPLCKEKPPVEEKIQVCEKETKKIVTINKKDFNSEKHAPVDSPLCKEKPPVEEPPVEEPPVEEPPVEEPPVEQPPVEQPPVEEPEAPAELPQTGAAENASALIGLGSIIASASYYVASRRGVISALINR